MTIIQYLELILIWVLICYLIAGFFFAVGSLFGKEKHPFYMHFLVIIFWSYSLYHYWRNRK